MPASDVIPVTSIERRLGKVSYTTDGIVCGYRNLCCMVHSLIEASPCPLFSRESVLCYCEHCVKDLIVRIKNFQFNSIQTLADPREAWESTFFHFH